MSGTPPYAYVSFNAGLLALGYTSLVYMYDADTLEIIEFPGTDLFDPGCWTAREAVDGVPRSHPIGSYNVTYPYCRTALKYNMGDKRGDPQIGQLVLAAPTLSLQILLDGCAASDIASVTSRMEPLQNTRCGVELYPGYSPLDFYLVLDSTQVTLPMRYYFTVTTTAGLVKTFWVGVRSARDGLPSGAVI